MAWRGEVEDGSGWGGLVSSKSEQREEARLAALERDAARCRWLRGLDGSCDSAACVNFNIGFDWIEAHGVALDEAIDAAMNGANP